ncbi:Rz1-like lysis system protein LysC [Marinicellulosiphila megalodicopiae]|uniref:Rz1-like lysis system protein LysC n=1 Tax=Marinicellulosiphila megalodicopiae TaxID=2724896 RepID=UPI003BAE76AE
MPPTELVQPCPVPSLIGETWRSALELVALKLKQCDQDKQAIRDWINESTD